MINQKFLLPCVAIVALLSGMVFYDSYQSDLKFISGEKSDWGDYQGRWVVVNFFAEWCKPCLKEVPELNKFARQQDNYNAVMLAISFDELPIEQLQNIAKKYDMQFPVVYWQDNEKLPISWPKQLPTTYILSPTGEQVERMLGKVTATKIQDKLLALQAVKTN